MNFMFVAPPCGQTCVFFFFFWFFYFVLILNLYFIVHVIRSATLLNFINKKAAYFHLIVSPPGIF